jgi:hypothetical protein
MADFPSEFGILNILSVVAGFLPEILSKVENKSWSPSSRRALL